LNGHAKECGHSCGRYEAEETSAEEEASDSVVSEEFERGLVGHYGLVVWTSLLFFVLSVAAFVKIV
jgi:hypothetical protein